MNEKTLFIIKPDCFHKKEEIISNMSNQFFIIYLKEFNFSEKLLSEFYIKDVRKQHYPALIEYMLESPCELGIIQSENSIEKFLKFAGKSSDPKKCNSNSLRFKYGKGFDKTKSGLYIIKNCIHRVESKEDFQYEHSLLEKYHIL